MEAPDDREAPPASTAGKGRWLVTLAGLLSTCIGLSGAVWAHAQLQLARLSAAPSQADPLSAALLRAKWEFEQQHRRAVVALGALTLVLSAFLFVSSIRVLSRVKNAGNLWRQALLGNVLCAAVTVWIEHSFTPGRLAVFRTVVASGPRPAVPRGLSLDEVARIAFASSAWSAGVILAILLLLLFFAGRHRTREAIG